MEEEAKDLSDYLAILRRRKKQIITTVAAIVVISVIVVILLPPVYRSTATILIEEQDIPPDLVRSTVTSYAAERIQVINQQVMTRANLTRIIDQYDLYPDLRRSRTTEEVLDTMRDDVKLDVVSADVIDPRSGRPTQATIAFTLAYDGTSPAKAQNVANELVSLYLSENVRQRTQKAAETSEFLTAEADKLDAKLADLEKQLAAFKKRNVNQLPELSQLNLQLMDRSQRDMLEIERQMRSLEERRFYLEGQLAQIEPYRTVVDENNRPINLRERLRVLENQYVSLSATHGPQHPDLIKLRREIDALRKKVGDVGSDEQQKQLAVLKDELEAARGRYSEDHPDVVRLKKKIEAFEQSIAESQKEGDDTSVSPEPDNPAYITLQAQLESVASEYKSLEQQRHDLKNKLADYEKRLVQTPQVEREYVALTRERENTLRRFQDIKAKQMEAQVAQQLESERKGERFTLIEPPELPEAPAKPNRPAILFLGFVFSLAGGFGYAAVLENLDHSVRGGRALVRLVGEAAMLGVIPFIETTEEVTRRQRFNIKAIGIAIASLIVLLLAVHIFWKPLDVIWFTVLRRFGLVFG